MPAPLFKVEVAFADGPYAAAPTYTDISQYVRREPPLQYSRGNTDEVSQLQSGSMSFAVDNSNGRFTPGSSASTAAWGTVLKIRRPVRLSIWNGTSYVVTWTGTVDDWGSGWVGGVQGRTMVTCSDIIAAAGRIDMPSSIEAEILSDAPTAYYPLNEPAGTLKPSDASGSNRPQLTPYAFNTSGTGANPTVALGSGVGPEGDTALVLTAGGDPDTDLAGAGAVDASFAVSGSGCTTEIFFYVPTPVRSAASQVLTSWAGGSVMLTIDAAVSVSVSGATVTSQPVTLEALHHVAFRQSAVAGTVTLSLFIDGRLVDTDTYAAASIVNAATNLNVGEGFEGSLSHAAFYETALSDARILEHANVLTGWAGETTGARWSRLCRVAGLGSTTYTADTTTGTMAAQSTSGATLASALQQVVDLEGGSAYCTTAGVLTLKARSNRYNKTSTLTIAPQTLGRDLLFVSNDAYLVNEALISSASGEVGRSESSTSVTDYGVSRRVATVASDTVAQAINLAQWFTYRYSEPGTRARSFTIDATAKASSITAVALLALDVDSRVTLSPLPAVAPASSVQMFINGLSGEIGDEWSVTLYPSPTTNLDGWVLGTSTLDTGTLLLY